MKRLYVLLIGLAASLAIFAVANAPYFIRYAEYLTKKPHDPIKPIALTSSTNTPCEEPDRLSIPSLDIQAPIVYVTSTSEEVFQDGLRHGVVHYPGTATPGTLGNVYIFGHSSDYLWSKGDYKSVFAPLPNIKSGDIIQLTDQQGMPYVYQVTSTRVVAADAMWVLDQGGFKQKKLTLQTSYPVGTAWKRFVVFADLVSTDKTCISLKK